MRKRGMLTMRTRWAMMAGGVAVATVLTGCILSLAPQFGWFWLLGADGDDAALALDRTLDGGFILAGYTEANPESPDNAVLIKINRIGQEQWRSEIGDDRNDVALDVKQTLDGGFVAVGRFGAVEDGDSDGFILRTDSNGIPSWVTLIDSGGADSAVSVARAHDGGYIVAAKLDMLGAASAALIKFDRLGQEVWRTLADTPHAAQAVVLPDGSAVLASWTVAVGDDFVFTGAVNLLKVDRQGRVVWSRDIPSEAAVEVRSIAATRNGFILTGQDDFAEADSALFLWKTDRNGNLVWQRSFGGPGREVGKRVRVARDGGFIVAGKVWPGGELPHGLLLKTDADGNLEWERAYGKGARDVLYDVMPLFDGTFFAVGETDSFSGDDDQLHSEVFAIKTDLNGFVPIVNIPLEWDAP